MPRKLNTSSDHFHDPFPSVLRKLKDEHGTTQEQLAAVLGLAARQSVTGYTDGSTSPTPEKIVAVAKYYGVTADYLLGLSDNPSVDPHIQSACKVTGLSLEAIKGIQELNTLTEKARRLIEETGGVEIDVPDSFDMLNELLSKRQGDAFFGQLASVQHFVSLASTELRASASTDLNERHELLSDAALAIKREVYWLSEAARALAQEVCNADSVLEELENTMVAGIVSYCYSNEGGADDGEHS